MKWKIILTLALAGASFADQRTSLQVFHNGWNETNPLYGQRPSTAHFIAEHTAINAGQILVLWKAKGKKTKFAKLLVLAEIADDSVAAVHNANLPTHPPAYAVK